MRQQKRSRVVAVGGACASGGSVVGSSHQHIDRGRGRDIRHTHIRTKNRNDSVRYGHFTKWPYGLGHFQPIHFIPNEDEAIYSIEPLIFACTQFFSISPGHIRSSR